MEDLYKTIKTVAEGLYKEKGSKFIALAYPVYTEEEIKSILVDIRTKYYDARHHCYAYRLGADKKRFRANDDGEPSSTDIVEKTENCLLRIRFDYRVINEVMKVIKEEEPEVVAREFELECRMTLSIRRKACPHLITRLETIDSLIFED